MELSLHMKWVLLALLFCSDHVLALQSVSSRKHREVVSQAALTSLQAAQFATAHRSLLDSSGPIQDGLADSDNDCSWVEEYKQFHKEQRGAEGAKYLVFGCFNNQAGKCPGLGDRFRGMEFAAKIAVHTKRVVLYAWEFPAPLESFVVPNDINWSLTEDLQIDLHEATHIQVNKGDVQGDGRFVSKYYEDPVLVMSTNFFDEGNLLPGPPFTLVSKASSCLFNALFKPSPQLQEQTDKVRRELLGEDVEEKQYVAIHLRMGHLDGEMYNVNRGWDKFQGLLGVLRCAQRYALGLPERQHSRPHDHHTSSRGLMMSSLTSANHRDCNHTSHLSVDNQQPEGRQKAEGGQEGELHLEAKTGSRHSHEEANSIAADTQTSMSSSSTRPVSSLDSSVASGRHHGSWQRLLRYARASSKTGTDSGSSTSSRSASSRTVAASSQGSKSESSSMRAGGGSSGSGSADSSTSAGASSTGTASDKLWDFSPPVLLLTDDVVLRGLVAEGVFKGFVGPAYVAHHLQRASGTGTTLEDHMGTFVDLLLLAQARCMVHSRSGFSKAAQVWAWPDCEIDVRDCILEHYIHASGEALSPPPPASASSPPASGGAQAGSKRQGGRRR